MISARQIGARTVYCLSDVVRPSIRGEGAREGARGVQVYYM